MMAQLFEIRWDRLLESRTLNLFGPGFWPSLIPLLSLGNLSYRLLSCLLSCHGPPHSTRGR